MNCLKATSVIEEATMKNTNGSTRPDYMVWEVKYLLCFVVSEIQPVIQYSINAPKRVDSIKYCSYIL